MSAVMDCADANAGEQVGCSKCRYSRRGCARCRAPSFRRRVPRPPLLKEKARQRRKPKARHCSRPLVCTDSTDRALVALDPIVAGASELRQDRWSHPEAPQELCALSSIHLAEGGAGCGPHAAPGLARASPGSGSHSDQCGFDSAGNKSQQPLLARLSRLVAAGATSATPPRKPSSRVETAGFKGRASLAQDLNSEGIQEPPTVSDEAGPLDSRERRRGGRRRPSCELWLRKLPDYEVKALRSAVDVRCCCWRPPPSPFGLIQEQLFQDPWRVMLACKLLNKTNITQVRNIIWSFLQQFPTAQSVQQARLEHLESLLHPLGIFRKRALDVVQFSSEFVAGQWVHPLQLHGVGKYAADAYFLFCRGQWKEVAPLDKELKKYHAWLVSTQGLGLGLERDAAPVLLPPPSFPAPSSDSLPWSHAAPGEPADSS